MLGGYNTNVRHRGVVFHVQTEDSGRANPRLTTHLYHGGTILASDRSDYTDDLSSPDLAGLVRARVEAQHKEMVSRLQEGEFDVTIHERLGPAIFPEPVHGAPSASSPDRAEAELPSISREPAQPLVFGDGVVSEKSLDEVILSYLVENARKRKPQPK